MVENKSKRTEAEKEEMIKAVAKMKGIFKRRTSDEDLHKAREVLARKYEEMLK